MRKTWIILFLSGLFLSLSAQTNDNIDNIVAKGKANWFDAVYLVLSAADQIDPQTEPEAALGNYNGKITLEAGEAVTRTDYARLLMEQLNISGGVMYSLTGGGRYAFNEFRYLGIYTNKTPRNQLLSGEDMVNILADVLSRENLP